MTHDIRNYVKHCSTCNKAKGTTPTQWKGDPTMMDWRKPIVKYLTHERTKDQQTFGEENETYFMEEGELQKDSNHEESKICIANNQIKHLIKRVHDPKGKHLNMKETIQQILNKPYSWPTIALNTN